MISLKDNPYKHNPKLDNPTLRLINLALGIPSEEKANKVGNYLSLFICEEFWVKVLGNPEPPKKEGRNYTHTLTVKNYQDGMEYVVLSGNSFNTYYSNNVDEFKQSTTLLGTHDGLTSILNISEVPFNNTEIEHMYRFMHKGTKYEIVRVFSGSFMPNELLHVVSKSEDNAIRLSPMFKPTTILGTFVEVKSLKYIKTRSVAQMVLVIDGTDTKVEVPEDLLPGLLFSDGTKKVVYEV